MPEGIEVLPPAHVSFETAYQIDSYPYGHRLRCKRRVWVEHTQRYGQRFVYCTTNPKVRLTEKWNTPHTDTYNLAVVLYRDLDDEGHIKAAKLHSVWDIENTCKFLDKYGEGIDDETRELIKEQLCSLIRRESQERKASYTTTTIDVGGITGRERQEHVIPASLTQEEAAALLAKYAPAPKPEPEPEPLDALPIFEGQ
jgi:hypothetical protein